MTVSCHRPQNCLCDFYAQDVVLAGGITFYVVCGVDVRIQRPPSPESNRHRRHHNPGMV